MSAANDGANADSKITAIARRLIFMAVLVFLLVTIISFPASAPNSTPPVDSLTRLPPPLFCRVNQVRDAPRTLAMVIAVMALRSAAR
jgi:hypothetical protein